MNQATSLYMFAIMPPPELAAKIHNERLNFADEYKFVKALKPPVHITLYPPFPVPVTKAASFEQEAKALQKWADRHAPFDIELRDFNFFSNTRNPVIYIDVIKSEMLKELHSSFLIELKEYMEIERSKDAYKPHFTIGYSDVDPKVLPTIREAYSKRWFREQFRCGSVYLWNHDGKNWQVLQEYALTNVQEQQSLF